MKTILVLFGVIGVFAVSACGEKMEELVKLMDTSLGTMKTYRDNYALKLNTTLNALKAPSMAMVSEMSDATFRTVQEKLEAARENGADTNACAITLSSDIHIILDNLQKNWNDCVNSSMIFGNNFVEFMTNHADTGFLMSIQLAQSVKNLAESPDDEAAECYKNIKQYVSGVSQNYDQSVGVFSQLGSDLGLFLKENTLACIETYGMISKEELELLAQNVDKCIKTRSLLR